MTSSLGTRAYSDGHEIGVLRVVRVVTPRRFAQQVTRNQAVAGGPGIVQAALQLDAFRLGAWGFCVCRLVAMVGRGGTA